MADEAQYETRVIRQVLGIETVPPAHATQPIILLIKCETATGPLVVRLSQIAAVELAGALNRHPLTRGSA
jgi:hypothetical protein